MRNDFRIDTPRLIIREVKMTDDKNILSAMSCPEIDSMHSNGFRNISHVQDYISLLVQEYENNKFRTVAIAEKESDILIGTITIDIPKYFSRAELGYWISIPYRNKGYATEAIKAIIEYGLLTLNLERIQALHGINNPASGRILEKAGMVYEGTLRRYYSKNSNHKMYSAIRADLVQE